MSDELKPVMVWCATCSSTVQPMARMKKLDYCELPVVKDGTDYVFLDWESADAEGDYDYVCPECERFLFSDIQDIQDYVDKSKYSFNELLKRCFIDDLDKMSDFVVLSKDEFLASYSYLTESEYDATSKVVDLIRDLPKEVLSKKFREFFTWRVRYVQYAVHQLM